MISIVVDADANSGNGLAANTLAPATIEKRFFIME
jgi:hypothetical protein